MTRRHKLTVKFVSLVLTFTFIFSELGFAGALEGPGVFQPVQTPKEILLKDPTRFETPVESTILKEIHKGESGTFIIHIQDAHVNYSGQANLASALDTLMSKYKIGLVLVEGGTRDDTLTPIKQVAPPAVWKRVAKKFLLEGKISGEEYLNLTSDHPMKIMGIENKELYQKSIVAYSELAKQRPQILEYLKKIQYATDKLKRKTYPEALLDYEKLKERKGNAEADFKALLDLAETHNISLSEFPNLSILRTVQQKESQINFDAANLEQAVLIEEIAKRAPDEIPRLASLARDDKTKNTSLFCHFQNTLNIARSKNISVEKYPNLLLYLDYLKQFSDVDLDRVLDEMERAEDKVYKEILSTEDSLLIRAIDRYLGLLATAYQIKMTTKEFNLFTANEPDFSTSSYQAFINQKLLQFGFFNEVVEYKNILDLGKKALEDFYSSVNERDTAFIENSERILKAENEKVAFLISGGYHTPHLKKLFREKDYSYAVLSPIITSETDQDKYEKILLESVAGKPKVVQSVQGMNKDLNQSLSELEEDLLKLQRKDSTVKQTSLAEAAARLAEVTNAGARAAGTDDETVAKALLKMLRGDIGGPETLLIQSVGEEPLGSRLRDNKPRLSDTSRQERTQPVSRSRFASLKERFLLTVYMSLAMTSVATFYSPEPVGVVDEDKLVEEATSPWTLLFEESKSWIMESLIRNLYHQDTLAGIPSVGHQELILGIADKVSPDLKGEQIAFISRELRKFADSMPHPSVAKTARMIANRLIERYAHEVYWDISRDNYYYFLEAVGLMEQYGDIINSTLDELDLRKHGFNVYDVLAIMAIESGANTERIDTATKERIAMRIRQQEKGRKGTTWEAGMPLDIAVGPMQIKPKMVLKDLQSDTWEAINPKLKQKFGSWQPLDLLDNRKNVEAGTAFIAFQSTEMPALRGITDPELSKKSGALIYFWGNGNFGRLIEAGGGKIETWSQLEAVNRTLENPATPAEFEYVEKATTIARDCELLFTLLERQEMDTYDAFYRIMGRKVQAAVRADHAAKQAKLAEAKAAAEEKKVALAKAKPAAEKKQAKLAAKNRSTQSRIIQRKITPRITAPAQKFRNRGARAASESRSFETQNIGAFKPDQIFERLPEILVQDRLRQMTLMKLVWRFIMPGRQYSIPDSHGQFLHVSNARILKQSGVEFAQTQTVFVLNAWGQVIETAVLMNEIQETDSARRSYIRRLYNEHAYSLSTSSVNVYRDRSKTRALTLIGEIFPDTNDARNFAVDYDETKFRVGPPESLISTGRSYVRLKIIPIAGARAAWEGLPSAKSLLRDRKFMKTLTESQKRIVKYRAEQGANYTRSGAEVALGVSHQNIDQRVNEIQSKFARFSEFRRVFPRGRLSAADEVRKVRKESIERLMLETRIEGLLDSISIKTIGQLLKTKASTLLLTRGIDFQTFQEIQDRLQELGLPKIKMDKKVYQQPAVGILRRGQKKAAGGRSAEANQYFFSGWLVVKKPKQQDVFIDSTPAVVGDKTLIYTAQDDASLAPLIFKRFIASDTESVVPAALALENERRAIKRIRDLIFQKNGNVYSGPQTLLPGFEYDDHRGMKGVIMPRLGPEMALIFFSGPNYEKSNIPNKHFRSLSHYALIASKMAEGIALFNQTGLVHGDVTPKNYLISKDGDIATLFDYDSSWPAGQSRSLAAYTPGYASPNQVMGGPARFTDDVFGLAATLAWVWGGESLQADSFTPLGLRINERNEAMRPIWKDFAAVLKGNPFREEIMRGLGRPGLRSYKNAKMMQRDIDAKLHRLFAVPATPTLRNKFSGSRSASLLEGKVRSDLPLDRDMSRGEFLSVLAAGIIALIFLPYTIIRWVTSPTRLYDFNIKTADGKLMEFPRSILSAQFDRLTEDRLMFVPFDARESFSTSNILKGNCVLVIMTGRDKAGRSAALIGHLLPRYTVEHPLEIYKTGEMTLQSLGDIRDQARQKIAAMKIILADKSIALETVRATLIYMNETQMKDSHLFIEPVRRALNEFENPIPYSEIPVQNETSSVVANVVVSGEVDGDQGMYLQGEEQSLTNDFKRRFEAQLSADGTLSVNLADHASAGARAPKVSRQLILNAERSSSDWHLKQVIMHYFIEQPDSLLSLLDIAVPVKETLRNQNHEVSDERILTLLNELSSEREGFLAKQNEISFQLQPDLNVRRAAVQFRDVSYIQRDWLAALALYGQGNAAPLQELLWEYSDILRIWEDAPVEAQYPVLMAAALMLPQDKQNLLRFLLEDSSKTDFLEASLVVVLSGNLPPGWAAQNAPALAGRSVFFMGPENWRQEGGLGQVAQSYLEWLHKISEGVFNVYSVEPLYPFRSVSEEVDGQMVRRLDPVDYSQEPIGIEGFKREDRTYPVSVKGNEYHMSVHSGKKNGVDSLFIGDQEAYLTRALYMYGDLGSASRPEFMKGIAEAMIREVNHIALEEKRRKGADFKAPVLWLNDAQMSTFEALWRDYSNKKRNDPNFKLDEDEYVLEDAVLFAVDHTILNREQVRGDERLLIQGIPQELWPYYSRFDSRDEMSGLLRLAHGVAWVSARHKEISEGWDPMVDGQAITNGSNPERSTRVLRRAYGEAAPAGDFNNPTPLEVYESKTKVKTELRTDERFLHLNSRFSQLDPHKSIVAYVGRNVWEKTGLSANAGPESQQSPFRKSSIIECVKNGGQVVLFAKTQAGTFGEYKMLKTWEEEIARDYPEGLFIVVGSFEKEDQWKLMAAADMLITPSIKDTEAAGLTEIGAVENGVVIIAPSYWEGIYQSANLMVDFSRPGSGNLLIPQNDSPEAYRDAIVAAIKKYKDDPVGFASFQKAGMSIALITRAQITVAAYLRAIQGVVERYGDPLVVLQNSLKDPESFDRHFKNEWLRKELVKALEKGVYDGHAVRTLVSSEPVKSYMLVSEKNPYLVLVDPSSRFSHDHGTKSWVSENDGGLRILLEKALGKKNFKVRDEIEVYDALNGVVYGRYSAKNLLANGLPVEVNFSGVQVLGFKAVMARQKDGESSTGARAAVSPLVERAEQIAREWYESQTFSSGESYYDHARNVVSSLDDMASRFKTSVSDEMRAAAWLHLVDISDLKIRNGVTAKLKDAVVWNLVADFRNTHNIPYQPPMKTVKVNGENILRVKGRGTVENQMINVIQSIQHADTLTLLFAEKMATLETLTEKEKDYTVQEVIHIYATLADLFGYENDETNESLATYLKEKAFWYRDHNLYVEAEKQIELKNKMSREKAKENVKSVKRGLISYLRQELAAEGLDPDQVLVFTRTRIKSPYSLILKKGNMDEGDWDIADYNGIMIVTDLEVTVSGHTMRAIDYVQALVESYPGLRPYVAQEQTEPRRTKKYSKAAGKEYEGYQIYRADTTAANKPYSIIVMDKDNHERYYYGAHAHWKYDVKKVPELKEQEFEIFGWFKPTRDLNKDFARAKEMLSGWVGVTVTMDETHFIPIRLPRGAKPADAAAHVEVDRLDSGYAGVYEVSTDIQEGQVAVAGIQRSRGKLGKQFRESDALNGGSVILILNTKQKEDKPISARSLSGLATPRARLLAKSGGSVREGEQRFLVFPWVATSLRVIDRDSLQEMSQRLGFANTDGFFLALSRRGVIDPSNGPEGDSKQLKDIAILMGKQKLAQAFLKDLKFVDDLDTQLIFEAILGAFPGVTIDSIETLLAKIGIGQISPDRVKELQSSKLEVVLHPGDPGSPYVTFEIRARHDRPGIVRMLTAAIERQDAEINIADISFSEDPNKPILIKVGNIPFGVLNALYHAFKKIPDVKIPDQGPREQTYGLPLRFQLHHRHGQLAAVLEKLKGLDSRINLLSGSQKVREDGMIADVDLGLMVPKSVHARKIKDAISRHVVRDSKVTEISGARLTHRNRIEREELVLPFERFFVHDVNLVDALLEVLREEYMKYGITEEPLISVIGSLSYALGADGHLDWNAVTDLDFRVHVRHDLLSPAAQDTIRINYLRKLESLGLWIGSSFDGHRGIIDRSGEGLESTHELQLMFNDPTELFSETPSSESKRYRYSDLFFGNENQLQEILDSVGEESMIRSNVLYYLHTLEEIKKGALESNDPEHDKPKLLKWLYQLAHLRGHGAEHRELLEAYKILERKFDESKFQQLYHRALSALSVSGESSRRVLIDDLTAAASGARLALGERFSKRMLEEIARPRSKIIHWVERTLLRWTFGFLLTRSMWLNRLGVLQEKNMSPNPLDLYLAKQFLVYYGLNPSLIDTASGGVKAILPALFLIGRYWERHYRRIEYDNAAERAKQIFEVLLHRPKSLGHEMQHFQSQFLTFKQFYEKALYYEQDKNKASEFYARGQVLARRHSGVSALLANFGVTHDYRWAVYTLTELKKLFEEQAAYNMQLLELLSRYPVSALKDHPDDPDDPEILTRFFNYILEEQQVLKDIRNWEEEETSNINESIDLISGLEDIIRVRKGEVGGSVQIISSFPGGLPTVEIMPIDLRLLWGNLFGNALKANAHSFEVQGWKEDNALLIRFRDDGAGMDEKILQAVKRKVATGDGEFTTNGTGEGLKIVHNIVVETHRGEVSVESQPGVGTTFTLKFPLSSGARFAGDLPANPGIFSADSPSAEISRARIVRSHNDNEDAYRFLEEGLSLYVEFATSEEIAERLKEETPVLSRFAAGLPELKLDRPIALRVKIDRETVEKQVLILVSKIDADRIIDFAVLNRENQVEKIVGGKIHVNLAQIRQMEQNEPAADLIEEIDKVSVAPEMEALARYELVLRAFNRLHSSFRAVLSSAPEIRPAVVLQYPLYKLEEAYSSSNYQAVLADKMQKAGAKEGIFFEFLDEQGNVTDGTYFKSVRGSSDLPRVYVDSLDEANIRFAKEHSVGFYPGLPKNLVVEEKGTQKVVLVPHEAVWKLLADVTRAGQIDVQKAQGLKFDDAKALEIIEQMWSLLIQLEHKVRFKEKPIKEHISVVRTAQPDQWDHYTLIDVVEIGRLELDKEFEAFIQALLATAAAA